MLPTPTAPRDTHRRTTLVAGRNCWRIEPATRAAFLIDGEDYFGAVRATLAGATRSFFILGWDIDSRMRLAPAVDDGLPPELGPFLTSIVDGRKGVRGHVLTWDYAMLYAPEREWWSFLRFARPSQLAFRLDDRHPLGASHHQKVIVVDDQVAFVSGFDLTTSRWDTSEHACEQPLRTNSLTTYGPFHDVGMAVEGACARALGELCRARWRRATGRDAVSLPRASRGASPWPDSLRSDMKNVDVAIARTEPPFAQRPEVPEVRHLHLDAIAGAQRFVFAENQYFTSTIVGAALAERLREPDPPEVALLMPSSESGLLETSTMGVLRARVHARLRDADHTGRYRMYCPMQPCDEDATQCINVHSKVLVVDDELLTIGSANLANRSMCLDTECNLAIKAGGDPRVKGAIARLRARLMAEHLGVAPDDVLRATRKAPLHEAIAALREPHRRHLERIEPAVDPAVDAIVPDHEVIDPDGPLDPEVLIGDLFPTPRTRERVRGRVAVAIAIALAVGAIALAWRAMGLGQLLTLDQLQAVGEEIRASPWAPLGVIGVFVASGLALVPVTLMIALTAALFGPVAAVPLSLTGALASGAVTFGLGRVLERRVVREIAGKRLTALSSRLRRRGLLAVLLVRVLPVAPYTVVNIVAGASRIRWRDFLLGTTLGLLPGLLLASALVDRAIAALVAPSPRAFATLALVLMAIVAIGVAIRNRFGPARS